MFVEIQAFGTSDLEGAIEEAFLAITQVAKRRPFLDVSPNVRHAPPDLIRLRPFHRRLLYGVLALLLFFSGAAWAYWNDLVLSPGDFEMSAKAWAMKIHRAAAIAILVLVGMLLAGHMRAAWRARRNRGNGSLFFGAFGILTITGYGLYYAGSESSRAWTSWIHLAVGLALPLLFDASRLAWETNKHNGSAANTSFLGGEIEIV
jgi:hypothetical protein